MPYQHTQRGVSALLLCLIAAAFSTAVIWQSRAPWLPAAVVLIVLLVVATVFSSLTVEVKESEIRWFFGPGFWSYRLALDEIESVAVARNQWWHGFGIRVAPGFRLYNVSGLNAVELRLKSNQVRRIGTDDPQGLASALKSLISRP
jgi:hypothetical protein